MKVSVLATGSSGNSYILKSKNGRFCVLDCGISYKNITNNKSFDGFSNLDFVFASHFH